MYSHRGIQRIRNAFIIIIISYRRPLITEDNTYA